MIKFQSKKLIMALLCLVPIIAIATPTTWKIMPSKSSLTFTATQNGSPVNGKFTSFNGVVNFYPDQLSQSSFNVIVDMASVNNAYAEVTDTLKTLEWFNVKMFPQAVFKSTGFTKTGTNTYQTNGTLTIRDKTQPVVLTFTQEKYSSTEYVIKGITTLKRTAFGVGQGEYADTKSVKDEVQVNFLVTASH